MKKILLVYLPFCTPASPPYSITNLYSFLKNNSKHQVEVMDLNLEFHQKKFPKFQKYYQSNNTNNNTNNTNNKWDNYNIITEDYRRLTSKIYSENNKRVVRGEKPELFDEFFKKIKDKKPDIVAFSIVYSSQAFYAYALIKKLTKLSGIKCVVGGPAVSEKLIGVANAQLENEVELLGYVTGKFSRGICTPKKVDHNNLNLNYALDFSIYNLKDYFTPSPVIPMKTTSTCYYKGCTFCTHFKDIPYLECSLEMIKKTIIKSKQKNFFLIDDMIPMKRLLKLAEIFKPLNIKWACQLKPTKDLTNVVLKTLKESGLVFCLWGVESGNDRILKLMNKGTNQQDVENVLENSHQVGIKNIVYIIFGFPTETKTEFLETIEFLKNNEKNIDLISTAIFGLHRDTIIFRNPKKFGITKIKETTRTVLEPKISYETSTGLSLTEVKKMRDSYLKIIEKINKYPKTMNFFREHMFGVIKD